MVLKNKLKPASEETIRSVIAFIDKELAHLYREMERSANPVEHRHPRFRGMSTYQRKAEENTFR